MTLKRETRVVFCFKVFDIMSLEISMSSEKGPESFIMLYKDTFYSFEMATKLLSRIARSTLLVRFAPTCRNRTVGVQVIYSNHSLVDIGKRYIKRIMSFVSLLCDHRSLIEIYGLATMKWWRRMNGQSRQSWGHSWGQGIYPHHLLRLGYWTF